MSEPRTPAGGADQRAASARWLHAWRAREPEFARGADSPPDELNRRDFLSLLGASVALAGLGACVREPDDPILPYVDAPADVLPGTARYYATAMTVDGHATGLLVKSHEGRPTKVEGNPDHPASLGAAGVHEQASVLELYDPHRARHVTAGGRRSSWQAAVNALAPASLVPRVGAAGAGLRIVLPRTSSPLIARQLARVRDRYPEARVYYHASRPDEAARTGIPLSSGGVLVPRYDLAEADVVVALDSDLLASGPFHLRWAHDHAARRRRSPLVRLFVAEPSPTPTGALATDRVAATPSQIGAIAAALLRRVRGEDADAGGSEASRPAYVTAWVRRAAGALLTARGRGVVVVGARQPAEVHAVAAALNDALGNVGRTVRFAPSPVLAAGGLEHDAEMLARDLAGGGVRAIVMLEGNPCYAAPADLQLPSRVRAVPLSCYLGAFDDETARVSTWHVPAAHYLESWGDTRAYDGTLSVVQPLIAPLYGGRTAAEVLAVMAGAAADAYTLARDAWSANGRGAGDEAWAVTLRRGLADGTSFAPVTPPVDRAAVERALALLGQRPLGGSPEVEIAYTSAYGVHDGEFGDNPWLQELPDPITKLTWGNALYLAPDRAAALGLGDGDVVTVRVGERSLDVPALAVPGHAANAVTLTLGYGRSGAESAARGVGADANALRTAAAPYGALGAAIRRTGRHVQLALTQTHWSLEGRDRSVLGVERGSDPVPPMDSPPRKRRPLTLYEPAPPPPDGFGDDQWAMVIDLDVCTGCSACVVACQAENNVPVVGQQGVIDGREMHWLRVDRYGTESESGYRVETQPMLCQHCEKAPCEYVCPVNATVHSDDGLNEMIYNRCVGTRFCSNNCPYKVRRFNWFDYNGEISETERMVKNPDVTVRGRGVMEKCTFCVQRVRAAQRDARLAGDAETGPVVTACQQTCPTEAIVFGSLTRASSEVAALFDDARGFAVLDELGTVPRVRYLRRRDDGASGDGGARS